MVLGELLDLCCWLGDLEGLVDDEYLEGEGLLGDLCLAVEPVVLGLAMPYLEKKLST